MNTQKGRASPTQKDGGRKSRLLNRFANTSTALPRCTVPDCGRPTMRAAGHGLAEFLCRYHVQFRARHGSTFAPSYRAGDLKPYLKAAALWIKNEKALDAPILSMVLQALRGLLDGSGRVEPAMDLKRRPAAFRSRVAFARLREAGVTPERLLAIHLAVAALIEDDGDAHRAKEFRLVQVAKAVHRLASGTHRRWDFPLASGRTAPIGLDVYPRSSGRVLRLIGQEIDDLCQIVTARGVAAVRLLRSAQFGPHPSHLPAWRPRWQRKREAAKTPQGPHR